METRLLMPTLQEIFATCWFCIKVIFISLVNPPSEEAFSEPCQRSRMELSVHGAVDYSYGKLQLECLSGF